MSKDTVYHYCSVETFLKIIKNKELWLTDVTKSNDSKELQYAYDILVEELDKRIEKYKKNGTDSTPLEICKDILADFNIGKLLFHVCCFSSQSDSLSQWAMYADNATGIAIGFKSEELFNLKNSKDNCNNIDFVKINYSLKGFKSDVNEKIDEIIEEYSQNKKQYENWFFNFINYIIDDIMKKAYFFKHSSFKQENEYRLVYNSKPFFFTNEPDKPKIISQKFKNQIETITSIAKLGKVDYYSSKGKIISYRPLNINNLQQFRNIITEIVIGPKSAVTDDDIRVCLIANSIDSSKIKIIRSKLTYQ